MKPNFLVIGAAKAGSTTLCHHLAQHPEVFFSPRKELQFFSFDDKFDLGVEWYESCFEGSEAAKARGEGSTTYTGRDVFPRTAERIAAYAPDMKLVYIVREPLARIESLWLQLRRFGATSPFDGVPELPEAMRVDGDFNRAVRAQSAALIASTNYWRELEVYKRHFPEEQICVLFFEELAHDPRAVLRTCFEFLEVDPDAEIDDAAVRLNSMEGYTHPREVLWRLWSSPRRRRLYSRVAARVPLGVRAWLNDHVLRRAVRERPRWEPATRAFVREELAEDSARLLEAYGRPPDLWELD